MNNQRGFTLLELLLGLLIFAIIGMTVYSVFSSGVQISERSENRGSVFRDGRMALDLMALDLENMVNYTFTEELDDEAAFIGNSHDIQLLVETKRGLRRVRYYLEEPKATNIYEVRIGQKTARNVDLVLENRQAQRVKFLMREESPFLKEISDDRIEPGKDFSNDSEPQVILMNVKPRGLRFQYSFIEGETSRQLVWQDKWDQPGLPTNVRLVLTLIDLGENDREVDLDLNILIPHGQQGVEALGRD